MNGICHEFIDYPSSEEELEQVVNRYKDNYLPGCGGSVDVVHVKWSKFPAGDVNHAKGKEGFPSLAFEVVMGFDQQILGVSKVTLVMITISRSCEFTKQYSVSGMAGREMWSGSGTTSMEMKREVLEFI